MAAADESNIGVWIWVVLIVAVNVYWISADLWLHRHGHELMTTEFQEGLSGRFGPFLAGAVAFTVVAFIVHMWNLS